MGNFNKEKFKGVKTDWETPDELFNHLDNEFHFTLDAAATEDNKKCKNFCDKKTDGLVCTWGKETVWCNPPYGRNVNEWLLKGITERYIYDTTSVFLILCKTNTSWWDRLVINEASEIRFIVGRPKFKGAKYGLPFPMCLVIYRPMREDLKISSIYYSSL